ncbi:MAG: MFS transporter, partial [Bacteroidales bacterium]|nr:MFS transporter [Bacteroidales bacterium]
MKRLLLPIAALLLSDALLLLGHGLLLTLLPIRAEIAHFSPTEIGLSGSAYFVGFVAGCLLTPRIVQRVGHIRSFAVLCSVFSAVALLFHPFADFLAWLVLRFMVGACISGLYMVIESWLNERST